MCTFFGTPIYNTYSVSVQKRANPEQQVSQVPVKQTHEGFWARKPATGC